jgi:hypothetical protein
MVKPLTEGDGKKKPKDDTDIGVNQPTFNPQTVAEFFFADDQGQLPDQLDFKEVDLIYNEYSRVMTVMHEKLRNFYNMVIIKTLNDKERREYGFKIE